MPGELLGQANLAGYSPRGHKESDRTEWLTHTHSFCRHTIIIYNTACLIFVYSHTAILMLCAIHFYEIWQIHRVIHWLPQCHKEQLYHPPNSLALAHFKFGSWFSYYYTLNIYFGFKSLSQALLQCIFPTQGLSLCLHISWIAGKFLTIWATREALIEIYLEHIFSHSIICLWTSLVDQTVKCLSINAGDLGLIPGSGRFPEEGNGNPLQYSCLENPMDGGA